MLRNTLLALTLPVLVSCSVLSRPPLAPLAILRSPDIKLSVEPSLRTLEPAQQAPSSAVGRDADVKLEVSVYAVDRSVVASVPRCGRSLVNAVTCTSEELEHWFGELQRRGDVHLSSIGDSTGLTLGESPRGVVRMLSQTAFVRGFEVLQRADGGIADPRIDVVSEGFLLDAALREDQVNDRLDVGLDIVVCELDRPLGERHLRIFDQAESVLVQAPTGVTWTVSLRESLARGEALVMTTRSAQSDSDKPCVLTIVRRCVERSDEDREATQAN
ncbi:MAG: hypothetical protein IT454_01595 [Planctomycetes bacterium]|nr:hypothetical protein [Planctomycetota bacterium]